MAATQTPRQLQIIDNALATLRQCRSIRTAEYDRPFEFDRPKDQLPHGDIYDYAENTQVDSTDRFFRELYLRVLVSFLFDDRDTQSTPLRIGNRLRAEVETAFMQDYGRGGLAQFTLPLESSIHLLAERNPNLAVVAVAFRVDYLIPFTDLYTDKS